MAKFLWQTSKRRQLVKEEFHYLNIARVGIFTLYKLFDCIFKCLRNTLCLSINLAAFKDESGKIWCELLSSDKYRDAINYKENVTSHHLSIRSPCFSSPCQNKGACIPNYKYNSYDCLCEQGFVGEYCEKGKVSCIHVFLGVSSM
ncbi:protein crumbs homolog 1-like [Stylophora pistillata]|uniref:protein crumbs homolog 1-like n=1 Tax=Stylophora pistillata TaxID=50429 RepID=UPI000C03BFE5|nr:protein crumbs homolog 1-like [Stylophora pistillata]